jgi:hypothetical protein
MRKEKLPEYAKEVGDILQLTVVEMAIITDEEKQARFRVVRELVNYIEAEVSRH